MIAPVDLPKSSRDYPTAWHGTSEGSVRGVLRFGHMDRNDASVS